MAGASSSEAEENYWPGYVDALTTMTMVLTFIMMILGVVIFSMSQNVSKTLIEAVATAAKIDMPKSGSLDEMSREVIQAIAKDHEPKPAPAAKDGAAPAVAAAPSGPVPTPGPAIAPASQALGPVAGGAPSQVPGIQERLAAAVESQGEAAGPAPRAAPGAQVALAPEAEAQGPAAGASAAAAAEPNKPAAEKKPQPASAAPMQPMRESIVESEAELPSTASAKLEERQVGTDSVIGGKPPAGPATLTEKPGIITVKFRRAGLTLDDAALAQLNDVLGKSGVIGTGAPLEIRAMASVNSVAVSESRRLAFFRAMEVRSRLIAAGIAGPRLQIRVVDGVPADANTVRILPR